MHDWAYYMGSVEVLFVNIIEYTLNMNLRAPIYTWSTYELLFWLFIEGTFPYTVTFVLFRYLYASFIYIYIIIIFI